MRRLACMNGPAAAILAVLLLSPAAIPAANPVPATLPTTNLAAEPTRLSAAAKEYFSLVAYLADPAREGRGPGTKGIDQARDFLVEHLRRAGLQGAFGGSFCQPLSIRSGVKVVKQELAAAGKDAPAETFKPGKDFNPLGFSAGRAFEGAAVFVGYGVVRKEAGYDSFAGGAKDSLRGKVAVTFRYEPQDAKGVSLWTGKAGQWTDAAGLTRKAQWAAERGAEALLLVNPPAHDDGKLHTTAGTAYGRAAKLPVLHVSSGVLARLLRAAGEADAAGAARKLQADADGKEPKPRELAGVTVRGEVELQAVKATVHNVAGVLAGSGKLADEVVVVGAHYDHIGYGEFASMGGAAARGKVHPGADDNASGAAGVVTLAGWFTDRLAGRAEPPAPPDRRAVVFACFTGEERGLLGSGYMAGHLSDMAVKAENIAAMINMDMIGRLQNGRLSIWGSDSGDRWKEILAAAAKRTKLTVRWGGGGFGPSDHSSFYRLKIPVLSFFTGGHRDIHRPTDTVDKINAEGAVGVLRVVADVIEKAWADPVRIKYLPPKKARPTTRRGKGAYLGVMPEPFAPADGKGCELASVLDGGPAAEAGLKAGDAIVAWNGRKIADAAAMSAELARHAPGQTVKLKVRRKDQLLDLTVKLGQR